MTGGPSSGRPGLISSVAGWHAPLPARRSPSTRSLFCSESTSSVVGADAKIGGDQGRLELLPGILVDPVARDQQQQATAERSYWTRPADGAGVPADSRAPQAGPEPAPPERARPLKSRPQRGAAAISTLRCGRFVTRVFGGRLPASWWGLNRWRLLTRCAAPGVGQPRGNRRDRQPAAE